METMLPYESQMPMLKYDVMTCRLHIRDMFDKMVIIASRGPVNSLIKCLHYYLFFQFLFIISKTFMKFWEVA